MDENMNQPFLGNNHNTTPGEINETLDSSVDESHNSSQ